MSGADATIGGGNSKDDMPPKRGEETMNAAPTPPPISAPEFAPPSVAAPVRLLSIPLDDGKTFDLRFPTDLSKEDFDFVVENIKLWERKIVAKPKPAGLLDEFFVKKQ